MLGRIQIVGIAALLALAPWTVNLTAQQRPATLGDQQLSEFVEANGRQHQYFSRDRRCGERARRGADLVRSIVELQQASERLRQGRQNRRGDTSAGVDALLERGSAVDRLVASSSLGAAAERDWRTVRRDLDELARAYNLEPVWSTASGAGRNQRREVRDRLTGTYQLDRSRGDEAEKAVAQAVRQLRPNQRDAARKAAHEPPAGAGDDGD